MTEDEKTVTLELTKAQMYALVNLAALGVAAMSMLEDPNDVNTQRQTVQTYAVAKPALGELGRRGWSEVNDKIMAAVYLAWPQDQVVRDRVQIDR